jgi:hypothetical protein
MTTAAKKRKNTQSGQALLEFIIMFPIILALLWYLLKVQIAINTSIVGQKHARSHIFLKVLNHRDYPIDKEYRENPGTRSVFWLGVAGRAIEENTVNSSAPVVDLGVGLNPRPLPGARDDPGEAELDMPRQRVRIRTAFGLCTSRKPNSDGSLGEYCGEVRK